jgi:hypothetical protein
VLTSSAFAKAATAETQTVSSVSEITGESAIASSATEISRAWKTGHGAKIKSSFGYGRRTKT